MGLTQERSDGDLSDSHAAAECRAARAHAQEKLRSGSGKPRRPDRAVYVPRALRAPEPDDGRRADGKGPPSPSARDRSAHGTPRRSLDKHFCNVYTPPHQRAPATPPPPPVAPPDAALPNADSGHREEDGAENFYIGDYFANGQLGFYGPSFYDYGPECEPSVGWGARHSDAMAAERPDASAVIDGDAYRAYGKDDDGEVDELKRASREINRSSKRLIKQSFDSDVLVISDPVDEPPRAASQPAGGAEEPAPEPQPAPAPRPRLKREENDWDAVFDDSGECLDPSLLEELAATVGRVRVAPARRNYAAYQTRGQALCGAPPDEAFAHVLEVYDFPGEFKTNDLLALFAEYKDTGFEIKWVDDTHALIVFSSARIAAEALGTPRSLARCRPLHAATPESRNKAKKCAEFLQPYRQRPQTCTALARRLVSGALGVRLSTAQQERAEERRLITRAREEKRQAALHKEAAWDGSLASTSLDT